MKHQKDFEPKANVTIRVIVDVYKKYVKKNGTGTLSKFVNEKMEQNINEKTINVKRSNKTVKPKI